VGQEHKRELVLVLLVMLAVKDVLEPYLKPEHVELQLLTPNGQHLAHSVHVLSNVDQEHKQEHELVLLVMNVVQAVLDQLPKHELVEHQLFTPD